MSVVQVVPSPVLSKRVVSPAHSGRVFGEAVTYQGVRWEPGGCVPGGRVTLFELPSPDRQYSLGLDFAFGLSDGDFDAGVMLRDDGVQVATVHGRWGETFGDVVVWPLVRLFGRRRVFIVGEPTATGLPILRSLLDRGCWLYYHRSETAAGRPLRDQLGHSPGRLDLTVQWLRRDVRTVLTGRPKIVLKDREVIDEMSRFQFRVRSGSKELLGARDSQLTWGAPDGEHDDLVRATAYANAGLEWIPEFSPPVEELPRESIGRLLGYTEIFAPGGVSGVPSYFGPGNRVAV